MCSYHEKCPHAEAGCKDDELIRIGCPYYQEQKELAESKPEVMGVVEFVETYLDNFQLNEYQKVLLDHLDSGKKIALFYPHGAGKTSRLIAMQRLIIEAQQAYINLLEKHLKGGNEDEE